MKSAYLLTGGPGVGKTTIIKEAVSKVAGKAGGFYTEEIRVGGLRQGFRLTTLDGRTAILAHIEIRTPQRVSKYGVDVAALEQIGVEAMERATEECDLVVIDEIGKMELFSSSFREATMRALGSGKSVLGTIMLGPHPWADRVKRLPEVEVVPVTHGTRQEVSQRVLDWMRSRPALK